MDAKNFEINISKLKDEVIKVVNDQLPRKVGVMAVNHFKENFRRSGFVNSGLRPWQKTKRQMSNRPGADSRYGPLTSNRNHLMSSIESHPAVGQVSIIDSVPYASIHNEGGNITTHPAVTDKMRKFAWAMTYSLSGIKSGTLPKELPPEAQKWRGLALTKKSRITINAHIPQRQFMGDSAELNRKIEDTIQKELSKIIK